MSEQIVLFVVSGVLAVITFFLKQAFTNITDRLDGLEKTLGSLLTELRAANVISTINTEEINRLRNRVDELSVAVQGVLATQNRCRVCRGDE